MKIRKFLCLTLIINIVIWMILININISFGKIDTNFNISNTNQFDNLGNGILGTVQVIGMISSVAALMIIGIKYMLGSAEEKSQQKETLIYYIIGAILVLSITSVVPWIYNNVKNII